MFAIIIKINNIVYKFGNSKRNAADIEKISIFINSYKG